MPFFKLSLLFAQKSQDKTFRKFRYFFYLLILAIFFLSILPPSSLFAQNSSIIADFYTTSQTTGNIPLEIQFTDLSTGNSKGYTWYFGDEDFSGKWKLMTASAPWEERSGHSIVALPDGSIVLMGGKSTDELKNDVWRSTDQGATWKQITSSAPWEARTGQKSVALPDGSIVLMGGLHQYLNFRNDVWRSTDQGVTWIEMTAEAPWTGRIGHSCLALPDGSIILIGGMDLKNSWNDVWRSTDQGATWKQITSSAPWEARSGLTSVVLSDGSVVLMGGSDIQNVRYSDVWRSTDQGATWKQITSSAPWEARDAHSSLALPNDSIILTGGNCTVGVRNDVWRSTDQGANWKQITSSAPWEARSGLTSVVLSDGSVVLMGGRDSTHKGVRWNDVWHIKTASSNKKNPIYTYAQPGKYSVTFQVYNDNGNHRIIKSNFITATDPTNNSNNDKPLDYILGDVNGDGIINVLDAAVVLRHVLGLQSLAKSQVTVADVNKDGVINVLDVTLLIQKSLGLIEDYTDKPKAKPETEVKVTNVTLNKTSQVLNIGETFQLVPTILPSNATNKSITWKTNNSNVAIVSNGLVTALSDGTAIITVTTIDGNHEATCTVIVQSITDVPTKENSRLNPARLGDTIITEGDDFRNGYRKHEIELKEVISGDAAWEIIKSTNRFNPPPDDGMIYILAKFRFKILELEKEPIDINHSKFEAVSKNGVVYSKFFSIVPPDPALMTYLYLGAEYEGWTYFMVDRHDKPLALYDRWWETEVWFDLKSN